MRTWEGLHERIKLCVFESFLIWVFFSFSFFFSFFFLEKRERAQAGGVAEGEGEADSPLNREPNAGLDPRTSGSQPEPKAEA